MRVLWMVNIPLPPVRAAQGLPPLPGGGWLTSALAALATHAPDIELICVSRALNAPGPFDADGVRYRTLPLTGPGGGWRGVASNWLLPDADEGLEDSIRSVIEQERPDVVHIHGTEFAQANATLRVVRGIPVVVSVQGSVGACADVGLAGLTGTDLLRDVLTLDFAKGRGLVHGWRRLKHAARLESQALALAHDATGRTAWDCDLVARANPNARYWHVDEVLRTPFHKVAWRGTVSEVGDGSDAGADALAERTILSVTSAASYKGIDVLLRAFAEVRRTHRCRLRVVGEVVGTPLWPSLQRLEGRLGLTGLVEWSGVRSADEVAAMLASCDVFACASRIENSPNSVCEAMLVGAPVVASRVGGIPSIVADGDEGLLFEPGDATGLADSIRIVLDDEALARRMGRAAHERALVRHDPATVVAQLLSVYRALAFGSLP